MSEFDDFLKKRKLDLAQQEKPVEQPRPREDIKTLEEEIDRRIKEREPVPVTPVREIDEDEYYRRDEDERYDDYEDEDDEPVKRTYRERVKERIEKDKQMLRSKKKRQRPVSANPPPKQRPPPQSVTRQYQQPPPPPRRHARELPRGKPKTPKREKRILIPKKKKAKKFDPGKFVVAMFAIATFFLLMLWSYYPEEDVLFNLILLLGMSCFLPIGMIIGWMFLDSYMRCKVLRKVTRKNLGIVNFVGKGKKITSKIRNFDEDTIWIKNKCWVISLEGIYEVDKEGNAVDDETNQLDPDGLITYMETVPVMFIDINTMYPLSLHENTADWIKPEELGSTLKGWVDNQQAKLMFLKRSMDTYFLIVIISAIASAYLGYSNMGAIEELMAEIETLKSMIRNLTLPVIQTFLPI
jgi:hypothetical protein